MKDVASPQYFEKPNHIRIFTMSDFRSLVERAGLEIERYEAFGAFWTMFFLIFWPSGSDFATHIRLWLTGVKPGMPSLITRKGPLIKAALEQAIPASNLFWRKNQKAVANGVQFISSAE